MSIRANYMAKIAYPPDLAKYFLSFFTFLLNFVPFSRLPALKTHSALTAKDINPEFMTSRPANPPHTPCHHDQMFSFYLVS